MVRILIAGLSGDSGFQVAALGLHKALIDIISKNELVYAPTLIDAREIPEDVDVVIIEGGVRIMHEEEMAKEIRSKLKIVGAIGSRTCFAHATSDVGCHWRWG